MRSLILHRIETLGSALSSTKTVSEAFIRNECTKHQESTVRSFLGCPEFLLRAVQFFSDQRCLIAESKRADGSSNTSIIRETVIMLELTERFDCLAWASDLQQRAASPTTEVAMLYSLSQAYKTATLLYGRRVLSALNAEATDATDLVSQLLGLIEILQKDPVLFKCLLWPTFIAGLDCWTESQQAFVMKSLRGLWDSTSCLNVIGASKLLQDHWKRKELPDSLMREVFDVDGLGRGWLLI